MDKKRRIPYYHHPLFTSVLPGVGGLSLGFIVATASSMTAYHFTNLFVPYEYPSVTPGQLTRVAAVEVAIPPVVLFVSLLIGGGLAILYRRNLRRYEDLIVEGVLLNPRERRKRLPYLQALRIYWPLLVLGVLFCATCLAPGDAQSSLLATTVIAGLIAGQGLTYHECQRIYERALAEGSPSAESLRLPLKAKLVAACVVGLLVAYAGFAVWFALTIERNVQMLLDLRSLVSPGPSAGPGIQP